MSIILKNLTCNPGLLPVHLGTAKLQISEHTLVHYFDLVPIHREIKLLDNYYDTLINTLHNQKNGFKQIDNYDKLFRHIKTSVQEKLINIAPSYHRNKRGLIDALGSVIKSITGNMDAYDAARIEKIIDHVENNQVKLQEQIKMQYSINQNVLNQFNKTIGYIQYNEMLLKLEILKVRDNAQNNTNDINILQLKDLYNQLIITYSTILNLLSDIENSLTFCAIGVMHPSIIKLQHLLTELENLIPFYHDQLPLTVNISNILNYESLIKVHCQHKNNKIIYFLTIPIESNDQYELFHLVSVPTLIEDEYFTIIPNFKYLIKNKDSLKPLNDICTLNGPLYHCPSKFVSTGNITCESNILKGKSSNNCLYIKVHSQADQIQQLSQTGQYLGWFHKNSTIETHCRNENQLLRPKGIFIFRPEVDCKIIFNGEELKMLRSSKSVPIMVDLQIPKLKTNIAKTGTDIELKSISLEGIDKNQLNPTLDLQFSPLHFYTPSLWTLIIYILLAIAIITLLVKFLQKKRKPKAVPTTNPVQTVQVPSQASF